MLKGVRSNTTRSSLSNLETDGTVFDCMQESFTKVYGKKLAHVFRDIWKKYIIFYDNLYCI